MLENNSNKYDVEKTTEKDSRIVRRSSSNHVGWKNNAARVHVHIPDPKHQERCGSRSRHVGSTTATPFSAASFDNNRRSRTLVPSVTMMMTAVTVTGLLHFIFFCAMMTVAETSAATAPFSAEHLDAFGRQGPSYAAAAATTAGGGDVSEDDDHYAAMMLNAIGIPRQIRSPSPKFIRFGRSGSDVGQQEEDQGFITLGRVSSPADLEKLAGLTDFRHIRLLPFSGSSNIRNAAEHGDAGDKYLEATVNGGNGNDSPASYHSRHGSRKQQQFLPRHFREAYPKQRLYSGGSSVGSRGVDQAFVLTPAGPLKRAQKFIRFG